MQHVDVSQCCRCNWGKSVPLSLGLHNKKCLSTVKLGETSESLCFCFTLALLPLVASSDVLELTPSRLQRCQAFFDGRMGPFDEGGLEGRLQAPLEGGLKGRTLEGGLEGQAEAGAAGGGGV